MSRFNTSLRILPAALLLLAGAASCSNDLDGATDVKVEGMQTTALTVTTDPTQMPATVYNYLRRASRAESSFVMPDAPAESVYKDLPEYAPYAWPPVVDDAKISGSQESGFVNNGQTIYVTGHWKLTGTWTYNGKDASECNGTIVVLPGATLEFANGGFESWPHVTIYNYGTLYYEGTSQCRLGGNITLYNAVAIDKIANLTLACEFYSNGSLTCESVRFNNSAESWLNCAVIAAGDVIFDNSSITHTGYVKGNTIRVMAEPTINLHDGGLFIADELYIENVQNVSLYADDGNTAIIKAGKIRINNAGDDNLKGTFRNLNLLCENWIYGEDTPPTEEGLGLNASTRLNAEVTASIETSEGGCAPLVAVEPADEPEFAIETIATITNDHSHPISATCIQFDGDKAYVSWHEKGDGIHGCIEVVQNTADGIKLLAYAEDPDADYNHIIVDGSRILTVGHNRTAAIVGEIALNGGTFTQGEALHYVTLKGNKVPHEDNPEFYGGDGNCIVRNGEYLSVASYGGLHTLNSDLSRMTETSGAVATPGSAKHLSLVGDKLLELNLSNRDKGESAPAELRLYSSDDHTWSNPTVIASDLTVTPIDGKNTIAIDPSDPSAMYVCLGFGGLRKYVGGALAAEFNNGYPANGVAVDENYVYLANGRGLVVFDKSDLSTPVYSYVHTGLNAYGVRPSCNYVAVQGDLIYIAYGRDGVDVLRRIR